MVDREQRHGGDRVRIEELEAVLSTLEKVIKEQERQIDKSQDKDVGQLGMKVYNAGAMYVVKTLQEWVEGRKNASKTD